jgi:hypothetical protein
MSGSTRMVVCERCGSLAIPALMFSVINAEGNPAWLCDECCKPSRTLERTVLDAADADKED